MSDGGSRASSSSPFERASADMAYRARVAAAYDGRRDVLDALWWLEHPDEATPSGRPSPYDEVRRLRAAVYGVDADPRAIDRYGALRAELAGEEAAIRSAVRAADSATPAPTAGASASTPVETERGGPPQAPARRRSWIPVVIVTAAVLAVGLGVSGAIGAAAPRAAPSASTRAAAGTSTAVAAPSTSSASQRELEPRYPTAPPTYSSAPQTPSPARTVLTGGVFIFDVPQVASDLPPIHTGGQFELSTFRALPGGEDGVQLYGALMNGDKEICIVAIADESAVAAGCEPSSSWEQVPLRVSMVLPTELRSSTSGVTRGATITWSANGLSFVESSG